MNAPQRKYKVIGITGGIASGKSSVSKILIEKGYPVLDADSIVHTLLAPGGLAEKKVHARFGTTERAELRKKVFNNPNELKALESILHPLVAEVSEKQFEELGKKHSLLFYEATLLIETGRHHALDGLWVVTAPESKRIERIVQRNNFSKTEAERILASQSPDSFRIPHATAVIVNDSTPEALRKKVEEVLSKE